MGIPLDADPNARAKCPRCKALVLVADWSDHDRWDAAILRRLDAVELGLKVPAPEPQLVDWPAPPEPAGPGL